MQKLSVSLLCFSFLALFGQKALACGGSSDWGVEGKIRIAICENENANWRSQRKSNTSSYISEITPQIQNVFCTLPSANATIERSFQTRNMLHVVWNQAGRKETISYDLKDLTVSKRSGAPVDVRVDMSDSWFSSDFRSFTIDEKNAAGEIIANGATITKKELSTTMPWEKKEVTKLTLPKDFGRALDLIYKHDGDMDYDDPSYYVFSRLAGICTREIKTSAPVIAAKSFEQIQHEKEEAESFAGAN